jgi:hypothetical protein
MNSSRKVWREADLKALDGMAHSRRDEMIRKGLYPPPAKAFEGGRANIWYDDEVSAHQAWRRARRDGKAKKGSSWRDYWEPPPGVEPIPAAAPVKTKQQPRRPR